MPSIDHLSAGLDSGDAEERREAAGELGRTGRPEALPPLFRAMGDPDWRVRKTAVEALVLISGDRVITDLIQALFAHDNAGSRNSAIEALIQIGAGSVPALLSALETTDSDVRKFIVDILGAIRDRRAVSVLIGLLENRDENIRVAAAEALGKIGDQSAVDALIRALSRYDQGWLDYAAAEALGEIGDERAVEPLLAALGRSSLREPVLESLGRIGSVKNLEPLLAGLADPLRVVREVSIVALGAIYRKSGQAERLSLVQAVRAEMSEQAVDFLEEMLATSSDELQKAAIAAIGWAGRERSVPKLFSLLKDEEMEGPIAAALMNIECGHASLLSGFLANDNALARRLAARVLGEAGMHEAESRLIELLRDENGHVRGIAAEALGKLKSRAAVPPLAELLHDEYENVQESAIHALAAIGDESVLNDLVKNFTAHDASLRRNIALLLGLFATDTAYDALAFALKDEEPSVRKAVVQGLARLPGRKSLRALMLAVSDDDPEVRMLAAEALGVSDGAEAYGALVSLLEDEDLWVKATAARALGRMGGKQASGVLVKHLDSAADIFLLSLVEVVGGLAPASALEKLLTLSVHADPEVRKHVLTALAGYPWDAVRQTVLSRLSDPHWSVRKAAVEIIGPKRDPAAEPLLERLVEGDSDAAVRQAAKEALGR